MGSLENPYWLALTSPNPSYIGRIAGFTALFATSFLILDRLTSRSSANQLLHGLSSPRGGRSRPPERSGLQAATNILSLVHSTGTAIGSVWTVIQLLRGDPGGWAAPVWQWVLAFSQGYFFSDALLYGTRREHWVLVHHGWMIIAHHPIGEPLRLCSMMGCGDANLAVWLSATGYTAEVSTVFLNTRWFHHKLLKKHCLWYTINSALLLLTYPTARVLAVPFILGGSLWPRWGMYSEHGLGGLVVFTSVTYAAMSAMSAYYTYTLLAKGLNRALYLDKEEKDKEN